MSKRRYESKENLDEIVVECLKKRNCEKTLQLFKNHIDPMGRKSFKEFKFIKQFICKV